MPALQPAKTMPTFMPGGGLARIMPALQDRQSLARTVPTMP